VSAFGTGAFIGGTPEGRAPKLLYNDKAGFDMAGAHPVPDHAGLADCVGVPEMRLRTQWQDLAAVANPESRVADIEQFCLERSNVAFELKMYVTRGGPPGFTSPFDR